MPEHTLREDIFNILGSSDNLTQRGLSSHLGFSLARPITRLRNLPKRAGLTLHFLQRKQEEYGDLRKEWKSLENEN